MLTSCPLECSSLKVKQSQGTQTKSARINYVKRLIARASGGYNGPLFFVREWKEPAKPTLEGAEQVMEGKVLRQRWLHHRVKPSGNVRRVQGEKDRQLQSPELTMNRMRLMFAMIEDHARTMPPVRMYILP